MAGYNYHYYLEDAQSSAKKNEYKDTTVILFIRQRQFKIKYRTSVKVRPDQWEPSKQEVKRNKVGYASFNDYLEAVKRFAQEVFLEKSKAGIPLNHIVVKKALDKKLGLNQPQSENNFLKFIDQFIDESSVTREVNTIKGYKTTLAHLKEFVRTSGASVEFDAVNLDFYNKFLVFLRKEKAHSVNSAGKNIKNLKVFLHESYDRQLHTNNSFSNRKFKTIEEQTQSIFLTMQEIDKMYAEDFSDNPKLDRVRDIFLIGCLTGLRFSDFSKLEKGSIKSGYIEIVPQKTKGVSPNPIAIPLLGAAPKIFEKYSTLAGAILPRVPSNQKMNEYIKEVGKLAKVNEMVLNPRYNESNQGTEERLVPKYSLITTHTARRSFATNAYLMDLKTIDIMRVTGHKTEGAFMKYIKMSNKDAADRIKEGWNDNNKK